MTRTRTKQLIATATLFTVLFAGSTAAQADKRVALGFGFSGQGVSVGGHYSNGSDRDLGDNWAVNLEVSATQKIVPRRSDDLQIWIWPDRGEGADYRAGDDIAMFVEANRDCYLILYNIDTQGRLNILFPYDPWSDNFVRGGETVRFPRRRDRLDWTVEGPPGIEYVQAIASTYPITPPDWPVYIRSVNGRDAVSYDRVLNDFNAYDDRLAYIGVVNRKITRRHWDYCATDLATFYVRQHRHWINNERWDPWPSAFYGEIYIGWPVGGAIFIDNIYVGTAPLRIPRQRWGKHVITCRVGNRVVRTHNLQLYPKSRYRYQRPAYGKVDVHARGHVKLGRHGRPAHYKNPVRAKSRSEHYNRNERQDRNKRFGRRETDKRSKVASGNHKRLTDKAERIVKHREVTRKSQVLTQSQTNKVKRSKPKARGSVLAKLGRAARKIADSNHKSQKIKSGKKSDKSKPSAKSKKSEKKAAKQKTVKKKR